MIRHSTKEDIPSLLSLTEQSGLFPPDHLSTLEAMLIAFFEASAEQDGFWLTDDETEAVGIVFCEPELMTSGTWNLRLIAVNPELQGSGRGGKLLAFVEDYLKTKDARLLIVDTSGTDEFAPVRDFYRKYGYSEESRIRDFFEAGDDKITFTKPL